MIAPVTAEFTGARSGQGPVGPATHTCTLLVNEENT
jgi:hypothetical protein